MVSQCQEGNNLQNTFQYTGRAFLGIQDNYHKNTIVLLLYQQKPMGVLALCRINSQKAQKAPMKVGKNVSVFFEIQQIKLNY